MPLVAARIGNPAKGKLYSILMEKFSGIDYLKMGVILNGLTLHPTAPKGNTLDKSVVKLLLGIAESDREWTCLRYAICKSSKMTSTALRKKYGFSNIAEHVQQVEDTMSKVQGICKAVLELASIEDKSLLQSLGLLTLCTDDSEEESTGDDIEEEIDETESNIPDDMKKILQRCEFNWFHFMDSIPVQEQQKMYFVSSVLMLESFEKCCLNERDKCLLKQSYLAFCSAKEDAYDQDRTARIVNREIVSESESDSPETYANTTDPLSATRKELIAKKRAAIRRRARRKQEKAISEQSFLSRKA